MLADKHDGVDAGEMLYREPCFTMKTHRDPLTLDG